MVRLRVWGLGFVVWSLEFRVWGLGSGVQGLGFGVWGSCNGSRVLVKDYNLPPEKELLRRFWVGGRGGKVGT